LGSDPPAPFGPLLEGLRRELGQELLAMDPEHLLHHPAVRLHLAHRVGEPEAEPREAAAAVRIGEDPIAKRGLFMERVQRVPAMNQLREVDLKLVLVARRVGTLDLAQLALKAEVHHLSLLSMGEAMDVAVVALVDQLEQRRKRFAVLEAHPAAVTDLEDPR